MLQPPPPADAQRLREFLNEQGYNHAEFRKRSVSQEIPKRSAGNLPYLLDQVREPSTPNLLLRWFLLGVPAERETAAGLIPEPILKILEESGLLVREGGLLAPAVMLTPCAEYIFASDTAASLDAQFPGVVIWPNPTTRLLEQFTIRRPVAATLDLGAGCGIQAILAARHSTHVAATDLNPRAREFTAFNARLNGIENVECLTGDTFDTVRGRTFDLIVANPPFFITPSGDQMYCENSMELDAYCRRVVREAPGHLNDGGFLQMTLEWVQVHGETWQERIRGWFGGTGCDAWVFHHYARAAAAYARERRDTTPAAHDAEMLARWIEYYRERGVEQVHGGILAMRRRAGRHWVRIEEVPVDPGEPFGEAVWQAFAGIDFLERHAAGEELLAARPRLSPAARLEQQLRQVDGRWQLEAVNLRLTAGIPASLRLEPAVADFVAGLDGRQTLGELATALAERVPADPAVVRAECMAVVRKLLERRFLVV